MAYGVINSDLMTTSDGVSSAGLYGFKNRLINSDMRIDQRNAGAAVTIASLATAAFVVDRWKGYNGTDGTFTLQQSTTAPAGFTNSIIATVTVTDTSISATQYAQINQRIEGFNVADLGWGTANAQSVTLSFWVRSSLTGTFCATLYNSNGSRCYVSNYTINSANTWEQKTITIAGDTSGTWQTTTSTGIDVIFCLAVGSTYQQAVGSWGTTSFAIGSSSQTNFLGTSGATFYITGVQLEKGSTATSFDYRPYGTELQLCQRYLPALRSTGTVDMIGSAAAGSASAFYAMFPFTVQTRVPPTGIVVSSVSHFTANPYTGTSTNPPSAVTFSNASCQTGRIIFTTGSMTSGAYGDYYFNSASGYIYFTGCEI